MMDRPTPRTFQVIHWLLALSLPLFLSLLLGCIQAPELKQAELGPEASDADIELAISKALYGIDPWATAVGQQVVYDFNARIENQEEARPIVRLTQTILNRKEENDGRKLTLTIQNHELDLNSGEVDVTEGSSEYNLDSPAVAAALSPLKLITPTLERTVIRTSYHNLKTESGTMAPPDVVRRKSNCGDVPNCQLRYFRLQYDEASWYSSSEYEVQKWAFTISRDAPFVSYIMDRCLASLVNSDGRSYYVRQCQFAVDFAYANANPPTLP